MSENKSLMTQEIRNAIYTIKTAILQSQNQVAKNANQELLSLYYGIGKYVSEHTRSNVWGTGAIETISRQLQLELPGLRGFSTSSIKRMRTFYEEWNEFINRPLAVGDLPNKEESVDFKALISFSCPNFRTKTFSSIFDYKFPVTFYTYTKSILHAQS